ncbi:hypothetical protein ElyMa_004138000 [Elysia marginata]|uniref:Uncharacterized protein n=1 Tax=Elysia marginata TaxID=1093978 RepID=A0AAV4GHR8_9GAST|nr:hypothetical protein ElyMa_004138000 [Elysia marginata]
MLIFEKRIIPNRQNREYNVDEMIGSSRWKLHSIREMSSQLDLRARAVYLIKIKLASLTWEIDDCADRLVARRQTDAQYGMPGFVPISSLILDRSSARLTTDSSTTRQ